MCASSALCNSLSVNVTIYVAVYGLTCINDTYEDVKDDDASYSGLTLSRMRNKWDKAEEAKSPFTHRFQPKEAFGLSTENRCPGNGASTFCNCLCVS